MTLRIGQALCDVCFPRPLRAQASRQWIALGGDALDDALSSGAIALLRSDWICSHASSRPGARIAARRSLPAEAFIGAGELEAFRQTVDLERRRGRGLKIVVVCHGDPDDPDADGEALRQLASVLRVFGSGFGVFWDYASLMQPPFRAREEAALFRQGLDALAELHAHPNTLVLRTASACAAASVRGWLFAEQCWASLHKPGTMRLELGEYTGLMDDLEGVVFECGSRTPRQPPLCPRDMDTALASRSWSSRDERALVSRLHRQLFARFARCTTLSYFALGWGDAEATLLARALKRGQLHALERLQLRANGIGDRGIAALTRALSDPNICPRLKLLDVSCNKVQLKASADLLDGLRCARPALALSMADEMASDIRSMRERFWQTDHHVNVERRELEQQRMTPLARVQAREARLAADKARAERQGVGDGDARQPPATLTSPPVAAQGLRRSRSRPTTAPPARATSMASLRRATSVPQLAAGAPTRRPLSAALTPPPLLSPDAVRRHRPVAASPLAYRPRSFVT